MESYKIFSYQWNIEEIDNKSVIRIFGLNAKNESVHVLIPDFTPYCYLELPQEIEWTEYNISMLGKKIDDLCRFKKARPPVKKTLYYKKKLYYANKIILEDGKLVDKTFPFLMCAFDSVEHIKTLSFILSKPINVYSIGEIKLKIHEHNATPILQLCCLRDIPTAGWISFKGKRIIDDEKESLCLHEFEAQWKTLNKCNDKITPSPLIMGFDIEVNSSNPNVMPDSSKPNDKVFQISCVLATQGDKEDKWDKYLLSLGLPDQDIVGDDVTLLLFDTEADLLEGFAEFIQEKNPQIIVGYNNFMFDTPYMIDRSKHFNNRCEHKFNQQGFIAGKQARERMIKWSSSAYGNQQFKFLDAEGRLFVDLLPLVKRDYKLDNYKLSTIATNFVGETKDPLTPKGIFKCYRLFTPKSLGVVGKYCIQDTVLVVKLFHSLQTWYGLVEMATTCNVPIFYLYTQGQQVKVFSQMYKKCMYDNRIVQHEGYITKDDEKYTGAYVHTPIPGLYDMVVSFDFSSLYPTTIIAYNIDYSTLVLDDKIPDEKCHIFQWEDHVGCEHDKTVRKTKTKVKLCAKRYFRFLKEPKGVLPTLLEEFLSARKKTNKEISELKEELKKMPEGEEKEEIQKRINVLDKRQLAYKVSANSGYGAMGVHRGYLPFMPGAMCTTARGRQSIEKASKFIHENYGGKIIYGDSVSKDTPIMIKYEDGTIDCKRIDELCEEYKPYEEFKSEDSNRKEKQQSLPNIQRGRYFGQLQVWTKSGWADLKRVIRHKTTKKMFKVVTHTGIIEVTEDHSLLNEDGEQVKPIDVTVGNTLLHGFPSIEDIPETIFLESKIEGGVKKCIKCNEYRLYGDLDNDICQKCNKNKFLEEEYFGKIGCSLTKEEAYVWGMFFAEGSCGSYDTKYGVKYSWAINNKEISVLEKCKKYLEKVEPEFEFKILDTLKSSNCYKLVCSGDVRFFVRKYRMLFYDNHKNKKVPYFIFNSPKEIQTEFIEGYYEGDGDNNVRHKSNSMHISIKGKIGAQGLYILLKSLGYKYINVNSREDKKDIYKIQVSSHYRKNPKEIKKIIDLGICDEEYVYDIETSDGTFHGGIGEIIVKNTDSSYVSFPHLTTPQETWDFCIRIEEEMLSLFPRPMKLAFEEKIYWRYFILTKKRYMALPCDREGNVSNKIFKRGVLLARRDNSKTIRDIYGDLIMKVFYREPKELILGMLCDYVNKLCSGSINYKDFIITKSIRDIEDYKIKELPTDPKKREKRLKDLKCTETEYMLKALPSQVQLAEKMRRRGKIVDAGTRLEYVVIESENQKDKLFNKIEDVEYFGDHREVLKIDYLYYLHLMINPIDEMIKVAYGIDDFLKTQYKLRLESIKYKEEINALSKPKLIFIE